MTFKDSVYVFVATGFLSSSLAWTFGWLDSLPTDIVAGITVVGLLKLSEQLFR